VLQPINFSYEADTEGRLLTMAVIGNSILWWRNTLAVVLSLSKLVHLKVIAREPVVDHPLVPVLLGYAALLLPWVTRVPTRH
jgi:hypothetical protein